MTSLIIILSLSFICIGCKTTGTHSTVEQAKESSADAEDSEYRVLRYFHGESESQSNATLFLTSTRSTISESASKNIPTDINRDEMKSLINDFTIIPGITEFIDNSGASRDLITEHVIDIDAGEDNYNRYVIPVKKAQKNRHFQEWLKLLQSQPNITNKANKAQ